MRAVVVGVDRANVVVNTVLDTGETVEATYLGTPPWPLATVWLDGGPAYLAVGALGDRRTVLRDDFMATNNATTTTANTAFSDTAWSLAVTGTGSVGRATDPGSGSAGVVQLSAPVSSTARIRCYDRSIQVPTAGTALWMQARVRVDANLLDDTKSFARVGFGNSNIVDNGAAAGTDVGAYVLLNSSGVSVDTVEGTSATELLIGASITAATFMWVDILVTAGEWAAFWLDGGGPYVLDSNVPLSTDQALEPFAYVKTAAAGNTAALDVDLIDVQLVTPCVHAVDYAALVGGPDPRTKP